MAPWIQNVAATDIKNGYHIPTSDRTVLISIVDPGSWRPEAKHVFGQRHDFEFLDVEAHDHVDDEAMRISDADAVAIANILKQALADHRDVVVHCHAGICRSGAVAEVGVMLGFRDTEAFRAPNLLVKHKLLQALDMSYDAAEKHTINGRQIPEDWNNNNEKVFTLAAARREYRENKGE